tara:strand:+ start:611 stop:1459 length:849 start_codon:yes stop_codon:yes gene_type:complete
MMDKQLINQYISSQVCVAEKVCSNKNPELRKQTINACKEYLDGFDDSYIQNLCSKYKPQKCEINECKIYLPNSVSQSGGTVTTSFRDVILKVEGVETLLRLPALYPKDCKKFGGPSSQYASCPCCFCNDRNAGASGVPNGQPMVPGRSRCINTPNDKYTTIYLPRAMQEILSKEPVTNPIIEVSVGEGKRVTVDVTKIIDIPNDYVWSTPQLLIQYLRRRDISYDDIGEIFDILKPDMEGSKEIAKYKQKLIDEKKEKPIDYSNLYKYVFILAFSILLLLMF